jgi:uncharacterized protein DUF5615
MKVLLDECVPRKLRLELTEHAVLTVTEHGWSGIKNGKLLALAETEFEVFLTVDQNLPVSAEPQSLQHRSHSICSEKQSPEDVVALNA